MYNHFDLHVTNPFSSDGILLYSFGSINSSHSFKKNKIIQTFFQIANKFCNGKKYGYKGNSFITKKFMTEHGSVGIKNGKPK